MFQPHHGSGSARLPVEPGGVNAAQRCEALRARIREQRQRLSGLPPDTHEAEYCRRHIRFCEAQLRALDAERNA